MHHGCDEFIKRMCTFANCGKEEKLYCLTNQIGESNPVSNLFSTTMSTPVFPTVYLPSVEYFSKMIGAKEILIENDEHYHRQSFRNRCVIYGPNGAQMLVVPVIHPSKENKNIKDIRIDNSARWQQIHWRSLTAAYNKSPFFEYYSYEFEPFYNKPQEWLLEANTELLRICLKLLRMPVILNYTENYSKDYIPSLDYRQRLLCKTTMQPERFPHYPQVFEPSHGFIANLSFIDLLFNRGNEAASYLRCLF